MPRYSPQRELPRLRAAISTLQSGPQRRYPAALRRRLAAYIRARLAGGGLQTAICEELGIGSPTFKTLQAESIGQRARLKVVHVAEPRAERSAVVVRGPSGVVIEGLDLDQVARLLRALA